MNKLKYFVIIAISVVGLSILTPVSQTAQAATWHKGTPRVIRGKWRMYPTPVSVQHLNIVKDHVRYYSVGPWYLNNVSYKKTGSHKYLVRGYEYTYLFKKSYATFKIKNHNKIVFAPTKSGKYATTYYRR